MTYYINIKSLEESVMQVGQRVRLVREVEIDWCGTLEPGLTGVVTSVGRCGHSIGTVTLDKAHPWFQDGGNIFWVIDPETTDRGGWMDWEAIS